MPTDCVYSLAQLLAGSYALIVSSLESLHFPGSLD